MSSDKSGRLPSSLKPGDKFACLALDNVSVEFPAGTEEVLLSESVTISARVPFAVDRFWIAELGRMQAERWSRCNLAIIVGASARRPGIQDEQEKELFDLANRVLFGLLLQGMPYLGGSGVSLAGEIRPREDPHVWSQGSGLEYKHVDGSATRTIDRASMLRALPLALAIGELFADVRDGALRLRRGFRALERAWREPRAEDRLHSSVRAIEALILPDPGHTRRQFIERAGAFAEGGGEVLGEIYDLRSKVEHMHFWRDALPARMGDRAAEERGSVRSLQAERIATSCYRRLFENRELRASFSEEQGIRAFWGEQPDSRIARWGSRVRLSAVCLSED